MISYIAFKFVQTLVIWLGILRSIALCSTVIGCFGDGTARDLDGWIQQLANNTLVNCRDVCKTRGYKYAGAQGGGWCLCGNSYGKYGRLPLKNCNWPCTADRSLLCGGQWANTVMITDPCSPNPCQNNGTCSQTGTSFKCTCQGNYTGDTCQVIDPCLSSPCQNEGWCVPDGISFRCICVQQPAFGGKLCNENRTEDLTQKCHGHVEDNLCYCANKETFGVHCEHACDSVTPFCNMWKDAGKCHWESLFYRQANDECHFNCSTCGFTGCFGTYQNDWKC